MCQDLLSAGVRIVLYFHNLDNFFKCHGIICVHVEKSARGFRENVDEKISLLDRS